MKNELTIRLNYGTDVDFPLIGKYVDKSSRKVIHLLNDYRVLIDIEPTSSQRVFEYPFNKNNMLFTFEWDSDDQVKSEFARRLKLHPLVKHAENKNADGQTYFILVDKSKDDEIKFTKQNAKVVVYNMVKNMSAKGLMEVAYFKMIDPAGKRAISLFNTLCDLNTGLLMGNENGIDSATQFITEWKLSDREKKVVIRKATMLGVIKTQVSEGRSLFVINGTPIGNIDNLLVYFNENPEQYSYVEKEVSSKDLFPFGITEDVSVEEAIGLTKIVAPRKDTKLSAVVKEENKAVRDAEKADADARKAIQVQRLKELNVKGWAASAAWSEEVRLNKIKEAETVIPKEPALA